MPDLDPIGVEFVAEGAGEYQDALGGAAEATGVFESSIGLAAAASSGGATIITGALLHISSIAVDTMMEAAAAVSSFFTDGFASAMEAEQTLARVSTIIEGTGGAAGLAIEDVQNLATQFMDLAGGSDDAVLAIEEMALRMGNITADEMPAFIQTTLDLAAATGQEAAGAARILAQAQEDPLSVMSRLRRQGILFTEEQKEQVKGMMEAGDKAGAFSVVMDHLATVTGGAAAAQADTLGGKIDVLKGHFSEAGETIMNAFVGPISGFLEPLMANILPMIDDVALAFNDFLGTFASGDFEDPIGNLANLFYFVAEAIGIDGGGAFGAIIQLREPFEAFVGFIQGAMPVVQDTIANVFGAAQTIFASVSEFVTGTLMPAVSLIWTEITGQLPTTQTTFETVMDAVNVAIEVVSDVITDVLVPAATEAVDWFVENWPEIKATAITVFEAVQEGIDDVTEFITGTLVPAFEDAVAWVEDNWPKIQQKAQEVFEQVQSVITTVMPIIQGVIEDVTGAITAFWNENGDTILTTAQTIWDAILLAIDTAIKNVQTVIETVSAAIHTFWDAWGGTLEEVWTNVTEGIGAIVDAFFALLEGDFTTVGESLKTLWSAMWDNIQLIVTNAFDEILKVDWLGLGADIIMGIINGITSMNTAIVEAAKNAASAALEAAKGFLGIKSPSRVSAHEIGEPFVEGIVQSLEQGIADVMGASMSISNAMIAPPMAAMNMVTHPLSYNRSATAQFGDVHINNVMDISTFEARVQQVVKNMMP